MAKIGTWLSAKCLFLYGAFQREVVTRTQFLNCEDRRLYLAPLATLRRAGFPVLHSQRDHICPWLGGVTISIGLWDAAGPGPAQVHRGPIGSRLASESSAPWKMEGHLLCWFVCLFLWQVWLLGLILTNFVFFLQGLFETKEKTWDRDHPLDLILLLCKPVKNSNSPSKMNRFVSV